MNQMVTPCVYYFAVVGKFLSSVGNPKEVLVNKRLLFKIEALVTGFGFALDAYAYYSVFPGGKYKHNLSDQVDLICFTCMYKLY